MEIWKLLINLLVTTLLVITLLIVIGIRYYSKEDIATIEGTITVEASNSNIITINYPTGFDVNNCYISAIVIKDIEKKGFNYGGLYNDSGDGLINAYYRTANLTDSNIMFKVKNPATNVKNFKYKIILNKN